MEYDINTVDLANLDYSRLRSSILPKGNRNQHRKVVALEIHEKLEKRYFQKHGSHGSRNPITYIFGDKTYVTPVLKKGMVTKRVVNYN